MAWFGGPAMPAWFADKGSQFYEKMVSLGVPIGDNAWAQQYGRVTLPGVGDFCVTPMNGAIAIARASGFDGRVIGENETPEKGAAVEAKDSGAIASMYADCLAVIKPSLWKGNEYDGRPFKQFDVANDGVFMPQLTWKEAQAAYPLPGK
jgi:hypothetical protein